VSTTPGAGPWVATGRSCRGAKKCVPWRGLFPRRSAKGFFSAFQHHQGVFAARKQQGGALKRGRDFAQDEDRFFLQGVQVRVAQMVDVLVVHGV
jgi:hypothetical protein